MDKNILIIGANSAIAKSVARRYAEAQDNLFLVARDLETLAKNKSDLNIRTGCTIETCGLDIYDLCKLETDISKFFHSDGRIDIALIAYGSLPNQDECELNNEKIEKEMYINGISVIKIANIVANLMIAQGHGKLGVITSVAADRGRKSNYIYGAAKAVVDTYLEGFRARLESNGIQVMTIKPGFVDTPMTKDFKKRLLWVSADTVAQKIVNSFEKNKNIVYIPWFWFFIMLVIKNIPEKVMKKLPL